MAVVSCFNSDVQHFSYLLIFVYPFIRSNKSVQLYLYLYKVIHKGIGHHCECACAGVFLQCYKSVWYKKTSKHSVVLK